MIYLEVPRGFYQPRRILKLLKSLYGLKQRPRIFLNIWRKDSSENGTNKEPITIFFISRQSILCRLCGWLSGFFWNQQGHWWGSTTLKDPELDLIEVFWVSWWKTSLRIYSLTQKGINRARSDTRKSYEKTSAEYGALLKLWWIYRNMESCFSCEKLDETIT